MTQNICHGTRRGYVNQRCRCSLCREAAVRYNRERRQRIEKELPTKSHDDDIDTLLEVLHGLT